MSFDKEQSSSQQTTPNDEEEYKLQSQFTILKSRAATERMAETPQGPEHKARSPYAVKVAIQENPSKEDSLDPTTAPSVRELTSLPS